MKKLERLVASIMLLFAIGYNLWIYRAEPTSTVDPNDNAFQFALVYRTNQIWDFAVKKCSGNIFTFPLCHFSYLADHWVPNWNEGYNLPYYYSHIPQITIVATYRLFSLLPIHLSLFAYYHMVIYLLLSLFPLSLFLALRAIGLPWITAGLGALLASQISTDGFYGLDPASFVWRGFGLSSQLFATIWLPLALAFLWRAYNEKRYILPAIIFLTLTTAGHLGIGIIAFLSLVPLAAAKPILGILERQRGRDIVDVIKRNISVLVILSVASIALLGYWILPAMMHDQFHNFSFWDPVWKFNSYGAKEVITRLFNGALFDFDRLPIYTVLVFVGILSAVSGKIFADRFMSETQNNAMDAMRASSGSRKFSYEQQRSYAGFALLFLFFLLLYFGRTTWGSLIDAIPAMKEFHLSRFIVGVHAAGLFLAPIGLTWLIRRIVLLLRNALPARVIVTFLAILAIIVLVYPQSIRYAADNDKLITRANANYADEGSDANRLVSAIQKLETTHPGRVFTGRGGSWGKTFKIAETPMFMYLSMFDIPTVLWLPETWSPNADTEQYFRENTETDYDLYNIRYVATPADLAGENIQPFWKLIDESKSWKLYEVPTSGYVTAGIRPAVVASDKYSFKNVIRLWIQSSDPKQGLYPELILKPRMDIGNMRTVALPHFLMQDEVTFQVPDGSIHNVFAEPPRYEGGFQGSVRVTNQSDDTDMIFTAAVSAPPHCPDCMVILKQTYHPNWHVTVDGKPVVPMIVFPFYLAIPIPEGTHTVVFSYEPSILKLVLLAAESIGIIVLVGMVILRKLGIDKKLGSTSH